MKAALIRLLNRLFPLEEINGREMCPTYLYRWTLFKRWGRGVYLHRFVGDDWSLDLHDHPRRFISIGLWGRYVEHLPGHGLQAWPLGGRVYRAPWIRSFPAEHVHRLTGPTPDRDCWTLIVVLKSTREWGFWHKGEWWHWKEYIFGNGGAAARSRKACP